VTRIILPILIGLFFATLAVNAEEIEVKIAPKYKISTADVRLRTGDSLEFVLDEDVYSGTVPIAKKGQSVLGTVTEMEENDFFIKPATLYVEDFYIADDSRKRIKLKGVIYKIGNEHKIISDFFFTDCIRGGEVHILPNKDSFVLYLRDL